MYVTPNEIREVRHNSLQLFSDFSHTCLDAGSRLSDLFVQNGRQLLEWNRGFIGKVDFGFGQQSGEALADMLPAHPFGKPTQLQGEFYGILEDIFKALLQATQAQVRICDQLVMYAIEHGSRASPWEGQLMLDTLRTTLQSAESALHNITDAAIANAEFAEQQMKEMAEEAESAQPAKKPAPRKRKLES